MSSGWWPATQCSVALPVLLWSHISCLLCFRSSRLFKSSSRVVFLDNVGLPAAEMINEEAFTLHVVPYVQLKGADSSVVGASCGAGRAQSFVHIHFLGQKQKLRKTYGHLLPALRKAWPLSIYVVFLSHAGCKTPLSNLTSVQNSRAALIAQS